MQLRDFFVCEDLRAESSGLFTAVGYMPASITVGTRARLCVVIALEDAKTTSPIAFQFAILGVGNKVIGVYTAEMAPCSMTDYNVWAHRTEFTVDESGTYTLQAVFQADGKSHVFRKEMILRRRTEPQPAPVVESKGLN